MNRAGVRHPRHATHELDAFTPEQLREMLDEPELTLIIGERFTEAHLKAMIDAQKEPEPPEPTKKAGKPSKDGAAD